MFAALRRFIRLAPAAPLLLASLVFPCVPASAAETAVSGGTMPKPALIESEQLTSLPAHEITTATPWTGSARFSGPRFTDVLAQLGARGSKVSLIAIDDYKVDLSMADIERYQPILALSMNGERLPPRGRGPLWLMFPFDNHPELQNDAWYFRAIWQIDRIRVEP
jgi:hypothetical protein